jgi:hypothetical protein
MCAEILNKVLFRLLQANYEYLTSDQAIEETINAGEYWFTATGRLISIEEMAVDEPKQ